MVTVSGEHTERLPGWSGDHESLTRLARVLEGAVEPQRAQAVTDAQADARDIDSVRERLGDRAARQWDVKMTVEERRRRMKLEHSGTVSEILSSDTLDFGGIRKVVLSAGEIFDSYAKVTLDWSGVAVTVKGPPGWMRTTSVLVTDEAKRAVPWWSWLRSWQAAVVVGVVAYATLFTVYGWEITDPKTGELVTRGAAVAAYVGYVFVYGWIGVVWFFAARWLLPGVEVVVPPKASQGRRAVALVGAFVISVAGSLAAGLVHR
jgi:hypothetical protein